MGVGILSDKVTRVFGKASLKLAEKSPHIMFGAGIVGIGAATFLACRATLKLEDTADEIRNDFEHADKMDYSAVGRLDSNQERAKDMLYVGARSAVKLGRLYGPAILVGGTSVGLLVASHYKLTKRNAALTSALATVTQAYAAYRERVKALIGPDREAELYAGMREVEVVTEDGRTEIKKVGDPSHTSPYAVLWGEDSHMWKPHPETNRIILEGVRNGCNVDLMARGHLFLNDVHRRLGLPETEEGQVVGWWWNGDGDNFIDFGMDSPLNEAFFNDEINEVWLDFNVDGPIHTKLGRNKGAKG